MKSEQILKQGTRIVSSGYVGAIVRHYSGNMYEVRLPGGVCCIDLHDIELYQPKAAAK